VFRRHIFASIMLLATTAYWAVWLFISPPPWSAPAAAVMATGVVIAATISVAGLLIEHSPLGYRLGWSILSFLTLVALIRPLDSAWVAGVVIVGFTAMSFTHRTLGGWIRSEPPVAPVPRSAVGLALTLLAAPVVSAFVTMSVDTGLLPWLALACWTILFWYVRRLPGALALVRAGLPFLVIAGWWLPIASLVAWIVTIAGAAALAWTSTTRLAIRPLIERGSRVLIPPELLPEDIRRSAGIDKADS
jgi:hypothetical protein